MKILLPLFVFVCTAFGQTPDINKKACASAYIHGIPPSEASSLEPAAVPELRKLVNKPACSLNTIIFLGMLGNNQDAKIFNKMLNRAIGRIGNSEKKYLTERIDVLSQSLGILGNRGYLDGLSTLRDIVKKNIGSDTNSVKHQIALNALYGLALAGQTKDGPLFQELLVYHASKEDLLSEIKLYWEIWTKVRAGDWKDAFVPNA